MSLIQMSRRGFTLVELLIVVAIIGVLSTIAVPTFRRMVQKAKKSEAKVGLGALYTAESAFFAEYNTFGNNLPQLGFELDGGNSSANRIYSVGFPDAGCNSVAVSPVSTSALGIPLNNVYPGYYTSATISVYTRTSQGYCDSDAVVAPTDTFTASSTGIIRPGVNVTSTTNTNYDVWTMTNNRVLANTQDGIQ